MPADPSLPSATAPPSERLPALSMRRRVNEGGGVGAVVGDCDRSAVGSSEGGIVGLVVGRDGSVVGGGVAVGVGDGRGMGRSVGDAVTDGAGEGEKLVSK